MLPQECPLLPVAWATACSHSSAVWAAVAVAGAELSEAVAFCQASATAPWPSWQRVGALLHKLLCKLPRQAPSARPAGGTPGHGCSPVASFICMGGLADISPGPTQVPPAAVSELWAPGSSLGSSRGSPSLGNAPSATDRPASTGAARLCD